MTINKMHEMVERFNVDIIGLQIPTTPTLLSFERGEFRLGHLREELTEIDKAISAEDLEETADGLIDLIYVALGTLLEMGIPPGAAFEEVHAANMRRVRGRKPGRAADAQGYDAIKPSDWAPPNWEPYLTITRDDIHMLVDIREQADEYTGEDYADDDTPPRKPKILVIGHGRHGKDTVAQMMAERFDLTFMSSSLFCAENIMLPHFKNQHHLPQYATAVACYEDRHNHRALWYEKIRDFNRPDPSTLGRAIFDKFDIYCGLRSKAELNANKNAGIVDYVVWVDRSDVLDPEDTQSITVEPWMADFIIDNNGSMTELEFNVDLLMKRLLA